MKYFTKEVINRLLTTLLLVVYGWLLIFMASSWLRDEYYWLCIYSFIFGMVCWYMSGCDKPTTTSSDNSPKIGFNSTKPNDGTIGYKRLD